MFLDAQGFAAESLMVKPLSLRKIDLTESSDFDIILTLKHCMIFYILHRKYIMKGYLDADF